MPNVILYCSFRKLRTGQTHVVTSDQGLVETLGAYAKKGFLGSVGTDVVVDAPPAVVLDKLEQQGYRTVGHSSFVETFGNSNGKAFCTWTVAKAPPSGFA